MYFETNSATRGRRRHRSSRQRIWSAVGERLELAAKCVEIEIVERPFDAHEEQPRSSSWCWSACRMLASRR